MLTLFCTDVEKGTFQKEPCLILVGDLVLKNPPVTDVFGDLARLDQAPTETIDARRYVLDELPPAPIQVTVSGDSSPRSYISPHYDFWVLSCAPPYFEIILLDSKLNPSSFLNKELHIVSCNCAENAE